jgi:dUTP pyrophosphatase
MPVQIKLSQITVDGQEFRATAPARGSSGAAGYDLSAYLPTGQFKVQIPNRTIALQAPVKKHGPVLSYESITVYNTVVEELDEVGTVMDHIPPGARALIPTGVQMAIPEDEYGRVAPRSGLAWKAGIDVMAGIIDSDYRGDIGVILVNMSAKPFHVRHGDRVAQLIFERISLHTLEVTDGELPESGRGAGGYGSTGTTTAQVNTMPPVPGNAEIALRNIAKP